MKKRFLILLATIIIIATAVNAASNFTVQKSYDWLLQQQTNGSFGGVLPTAASVLALNAAGYSPEASLEYLATQESVQNCWPSSGCRVKETSFVTLAYMAMGKDMHEIQTWMKNAQSAAMQSGNWWLEVATTEKGSCTVEYTKNDQNVVKTINVDNGRFPNCGNTTFYNINNCLEPNFIKTFPTIKLHIDCGTMSSALISLIYNSANSYYLLTDSQSGVAEITIENGCYGLSYKDGLCNYETTLYANWVLNAIETESSSKIYLADNYDKTNTLHNSLLYMIFKDENYLAELKSRQRSDGSWDGDVYRTAMALLAMKNSAEYSTQFSKGVSWLKTKQRDDGSFGDVTTTAMVLYAAFTEGGIEFPSCTNGRKDTGERGIDCGGVCEQYDDCCSNNIKDIGELGIDCGGVCEDCTSEVCNRDGICDKSEGENCKNCPEDCEECGVCNDDGVCDSDEGEDCYNCPDDCKVCEDLCNKDGQCDDVFGENCHNCEADCGACEEICDNNGVCDINLIETRGLSENENFKNCPGDCKHGDGVCDDLENYYNAPEDCEAPPEGCGDGICDTGTETVENCPEDCGEAECNSDGICDENETCSCEDCAEEEICKQGGGFPWWIVIALLLMFLALIGYTLYKKKKTKKKGTELFGFGKPLFKKPEAKEFKPIGPIKETKITPIKEEKRMPIMREPIRPKQEPSKIEQELEKSISEAKRLLGKK